MPIVRIELFPGRSHEKKAELAREITSTLERVADIKPEATTVLFAEVSPKEWFVAGEPFAAATKS
ncbi:4-oxalocrotonate tautomerase family protein [Rhizobium sp. AU243]|uniref:tautomerase family protein n=1 Tax=Rhizobium sp. AU243 TaxID=2303425 RepID=UPI0010CBF745|nr:4-oxalocrotonate tautomerase family protein [Rhizobium sp. AU243]TKV70756.1 4-oxalocrotonate tautomerase family protein [Rhizobium sp. AU243]